MWLINKFLPSSLTEKKSTVVFSNNVSFDDSNSEEKVTVLTKKEIEKNIEENLPELTKLNVQSEEIHGKLLKARTQIHHVSIKLGESNISENEKNELNINKEKLADEIEELEKESQLLDGNTEMEGKITLLQNKIINIEPTFNEFLKLESKETKKGTLNKIINGFDQKDPYLKEKISKAKSDHRENIINSLGLIKSLDNKLKIFEDNLEERKTKVNKGEGNSTVYAEMDTLRNNISAITKLKKAAIARIENAKEMHDKEITEKEAKRIEERKRYIIEKMVRDGEFYEDENDEDKELREKMDKEENEFNKRFNKELDQRSQKKKIFKDNITKKVDFELESQEDREIYNEIMEEFRKKEEKERRDKEFEFQKKKKIEEKLNVNLIDFDQEGEEDHKNLLEELNFNVNFNSSGQDLFKINFDQEVNDNNGNRNIVNEKFNKLFNETNKKFKISISNQNNKMTELQKDNDLLNEESIICKPYKNYPYDPRTKHNSEFKEDQIDNSTQLMLTQVYNLSRLRSDLKDNQIKIRDAKKNNITQKQVEKAKHDINLLEPRIKELEVLISNSGIVVWERGGVDLLRETLKNMLNNPELLGSQKLLNIIHKSVEDNILEKEKQLRKEREEEEKWNQKFNKKDNNSGKINIKTEEELEAELKNDFLKEFEKENGTSKKVTYFFEHNDGIETSNEIEFSEDDVLQQLKNESNQREKNPFSFGSGFN